MHPIPGCRGGHPDFPNALEALLRVCEPQPSTWSERVLGSLWEDLRGLRAVTPLSHRSRGMRPGEQQIPPRVYTVIKSREWSNAFLSPFG